MNTQLCYFLEMRYAYYKNESSRSMQLSIAYKNLHFLIFPLTIDQFVNKHLLGLSHRFLTHCYLNAAWPRFLAASTFTPAFHNMS